MQRFVLRNLKNRNIEKHTSNQITVSGCLMVKNGLSSHSHLINPQFPYNDVMHCGGNFLPCVVIVAFPKDCMNCACVKGRSKCVTVIKL